jgi:amino acid transporter
MEPDTSTPLDAQGRDGAKPDAGGGRDGASEPSGDPDGARPSASGERALGEQPRRSKNQTRRSQSDGDEETTPTLDQRRVVQGRIPGDKYVSFRHVHTDEFQPRGQGVLEASERVLAPRTPAGRLYERVKRVVVGERLATQMQIHERLTKVKALAVLSSDAISSVAYATEASLGVLILAGVAAMRYNLALAAAIVLLLAIVGTSYRQTIYAYPHGGGSYIVAHDNLGMWPGLIAAAALLIDYVLTVSVSVSSGIDFLISAVPRLAGLDVVLGVGCVLLILLINLRGIRESGSIFAAPTYLFIVVFALMIAVGVLHAIFSPGGLLGALPPVATPAERGWSGSLQPLTLFLVLTAFASGCSAMTGTEAISNGIPAFKAPESKNAARTLIAMVIILASFFVGTSYLAWRFGIVPYASQQPTVDHQIAATLFSGSASGMVYVIDFATLLILVLAANTSFADFPRLSSILARDGFLPHLFALRGDRLAFSVGIGVLGVLSSVLIVIFRGSTDALINLYALGVFVAFTLSQSGMVVHWYRLREAAGLGWRRSMIINGIGAATTGLVAVIIGVAKFDRGAWIVVLLIPMIVLMFYGIHRHYARVARETQVPRGTAARPERLEEQAGLALTPLRAEEIHHRMIVPIARLDQPALQSLAYARSISPFVTAVHVVRDAADSDALGSQWEQWAAGRRTTWEREAQDFHARTERGQPQNGARGQPNGQTNARTAEDAQKDAQIVAALRQGPTLARIRLTSGSVVAELVRYVRRARDAHREDTVTVVVPEMAASRRWRRGVFSSLRALRLKLALYGRPGVVVANLPLFSGTQGAYTQLAAGHSAPSGTSGPAGAASARVTLRPDELRHLVIVPIDKLNAPALQSLAYARSISPFVTAVHVAIDPAEEQTLRQAWAEWITQRTPAWQQAAENSRARALPWDDRTQLEKRAAAIERGPQLIVIESPYRSLVAPLVAYIDAQREGNPNATVTIVLPEFVPAHWWEHLLHNQTAARLKLALYARPGVVVVNVPYHLTGDTVSPRADRPR